MRRRLLAAVLLASLATPPAVSAAAGPRAASHRGVTQYEVAFTVDNSNTSDGACPSDGATYEVHGILAGPTSAFASGRPLPVSVYLHGFSFGGLFLWSFDAVPGYDLPVEMAELGHVSLAIDRLGYDRSGHPHGHLTCLGSSADVVHQIIQALRRGEYRVAGAVEPPEFSRVALVGHDTGGAVAEIEAYSYDDIDGLVVWGWADQGFTSWTLDQMPGRLALCARGGEEAESEAPGGGYFHWPPSEQEVRDGVGERMDPAVLDAAVNMRNRNPCGDLTSAALLANHHENTPVLGQIEVPVLLMYSDHDLIFTREGAEQQRAHFTGSDDLTFEMLDDAGHFPMLELRAAEHRALLSDWLHARGFGSKSRTV